LIFEISPIHDGAKVGFIFEKCLCLQKKKLKKRKKSKSTPPDSVPMLRKNKQIIYFNDKEMEAVSYFCKKYKIESKSRFYRETIIIAILKKMEEDHPKLF